MEFASKHVHALVFVQNSILAQNETETPIFEGHSANENFLLHFGETYRRQYKASMMNFIIKLIH